MKIGERLAMDPAALETIVDILRVRAEDRLVIVLKRADEGMVTQVKEALDVAGLSRQTLVFAIPPSEGEVILLRGQGD